MIIIAGHLLVNADQRDAAVQAHRDLVTRARAFDGCLEIAITADSVDPERINNLEIWRDEDALEAWRGRADAPDGPEPREVVMARYDATDGGPLFPEQ